MFTRVLLTAARVAAKTYLAYKAGNLAYLWLILNDEELNLVGNLITSFGMMTRSHIPLVLVTPVVYLSVVMILSGPAF
ncbi:MAG: hypothetical protein DI628_06245 [Blastochloris viridis]|uniref:Uncharacterized protein n=1 Tax=Blastochloris viridis TaxID=1079 RepID=A0A6N4RBQ6_BLAVI|nr:MAG: hypothetical protein DI628_06245 [Blastochloris viridis]